MKLKIIVIGLIFVLLAVYLSGCVESDEVSGTYRCATDDGVLYLQNGEYEIDCGYWASGSYSVMDNTVIMKEEMDFGITVPLTINGRDLIDPNGDLWVRD